MKTATQLKLEGMYSAAQHHAEDLGKAKQIAKALGRKKQFVHADMVREAFAAMYERPLQIGNAMGCIFHNPDWEFAGFTRSNRRESRKRTIKTWKLRKKEASHAAPVAPKAVRLGNRA